MIQSTDVIQFNLVQFVLGLISIGIVGFGGSFLGSIRAETRHEGQIKALEDGLKTESEDRKADVDRLEGRIETVDGHVRQIDKSRYRPRGA